MLYMFSLLISDILSDLHAAGRVDLICLSLQTWSVLTDVIQNKQHTQTEKKNNSIRSIQIKNHTRNTQNHTN